MRVLITGITGFAGSFLAEPALAQEDVEVVGVGLPQAGPGHAGHLLHRLRLFQGSLNDRGFAAEVIAAARPDRVFHLAAQAAPARSFADPGDTLMTNILGQVNLFEECLAQHLDPVLLVIGSGDEYGLVRPEDLPIAESTPFRPTSPYAVSKIAQDLLGLQYFLSHRLRCVRVRPFNHIGPRQSDAFVVASFARQVAEAEAGLTPPVIRVGNLEPARDFTDVRDMVRAYWIAAERGQAGDVYNIGSGRAHRIGDILTALVAMSRAPLTVEVDPARLRPTDVQVTICDAGKFMRATGWRPVIAIEQTLRDVLDYWRQRVTQVKR